MKSFIFSGFALLAVCCVSLVAADTPSGGDFPPTVSFQEGGQTYDLQLTGSALRRKYGLVKVYYIGSYVQDAAALQGADKFQALVASDKAKQLTMRWVRDVPAAKAQEAYHEGFAKTLPDATQATKADIDTYIGFFSADVQKGDETILRWLPGGEVQAMVNGKVVGTIKNPELAKGLWLIWFGEKSIVTREELVSQIK